MISLLAASVCLGIQVPQLKVLWTLDTQLTIEDRITHIQTLAKLRDGKTIRFMTNISTGPIPQGQQSPPQYFCEVDMATGAQKVLNTFSLLNDIIDGKYVWDMYGMDLDGDVSHVHKVGDEYQAAFVDPTTYDPVLELQAGDLQYPEPVDEDRAEKMVLPRAKFKLQALGDVEVLWDSPTVRLMLVNGELRSYKPLTWTQDGNPILTATSVSGIKTWKDAALIGNPDEGPFAIRVPSSLGMATVFLDADWNLISGAPQCACFDVSPRGFLIGPASAMSRPLAACLDPKTGKQKWALPNPNTGQRLFWAGDDVVFVDESKGLSFLHVLDGETGKTIGQDPLPASPINVLWVSGDFILMQDFKNRYYCCQFKES